MFANWSNTQKVLGVIGLVAIILLLLNWEKVWAWVKSLGGEPAPERIADETTAPTIQQVVVVPRPAAPTCDQIKQQVDYFTGLVAQYPNSVQLKARLDQLKKQYADNNCDGGPKPNPNSAA